MKNLLYIVMTILIAQVCKAQTTTDYFGQIPPGDTAVIFAPGIISLPDRNETNITFSPDGNEVYLEGNDGIYYTKRVNDTWSQQVKEPIFDGFGCPVFSANGNKMYLVKWSSGYSTSDIWMSERTSTVWSAPVILPSPINSSSIEGCYTETNDSVLYISSNRSGKSEIWCIRPLATQAENLGTVINSSSASDPCITHDGSYLIFWSDRPGTIGVGDLYVSFNKGNNLWTVPINMESSGAGINKAQHNVISPSLSPDGKYLFFNRHSLVLDPDIYWVSTHILVGLKKTVFAPKLSNQIPAKIIKADTVFNYIIPGNTFSCEYGTDSLQYSASLSNGSVLPSWLTFNAGTRTLSGTPRQAEIDTIKITATNKDTVSASCTFRITVTASDQETVTDIDGNVYQTIKIGTQVWMKENLRTTKFNDGNEIPKIDDATAWCNLTTSGVCTNNNTNNIDSINTYGRLYNWNAVNTGKLAPAGWHVPNYTEFSTLEAYLIANGYNYDGTTMGNKIAKSLASTTGWASSSIVGAIGNTDFFAKRNETGFTALPGGYRDPDGLFITIGTYGQWWCSSKINTDHAYHWDLAYNANSLDNYGGNMLAGFSVRCIKDAVTGVDESKNTKQIPEELTLHQNYPNPFNPSTVISYQLSVSSNVKLKIYDTLGREIRTLINSFQSAGEHSIVWDATDNSNNPISSGVYFYKMETNGTSFQKKMIFDSLKPYKLKNEKIP